MEEMVTVAERKRLTGLRPYAYEHPLDSKALNTLEGTPGLETLVRKFNQWGLERFVRVQLTGSNLHVNAENLPELHELLGLAVEILDVPKVPELYVTEGGDLSAFTSGVERPAIVISSMAIDKLTDDELLFVLGHELGHIKSGHVLYHQVAAFLPLIGNMVGGLTLGIGELASTGLRVALLNWQRMSEFTADRAGLLTCQNVDVAINTMVKLAGLPRKYYGSFAGKHFIAQAREFQTLDTDELSWIAKGLSILGATHPWTVMRANQCLTWIDSKEYSQVLNAPHSRMHLNQFCTSCGNLLKGIEIYCQKCGKKIQPAAASDQLAEAK